MVELLEDVASALAVNAEIGNGTTETVLSVTGNTSALVVERVRLARYFCYKNSFSILDIPFVSFLIRMISALYKCLEDNSVPQELMMVCI